jgi:hypothetical protein
MISFRSKEPGTSDRVDRLVERTNAAPKQPRDDKTVSRLSKLVPCNVSAVG